MEILKERIVDGFFQSEIAFGVTGVITNLGWETHGTAFGSSKIDASLWNWKLNFSNLPWVHEVISDLCENWGLCIQSFCFRYIVGDDRGDFT